jgi:hypothetical protein
MSEPIAVNVAEAACLLSMSRASFDRHVRYEVRTVRRGRMLLIPSLNSRAGSIRTPPAAPRKLGLRRNGAPLAPSEPFAGLALPAKPHRAEGRANVMPATRSGAT